VKPFPTKHYELMMPRIRSFILALGVSTLTACGGGGGGGGPTTPGVASVAPSNGATNVAKDASITATFSGGFDDLATQIPAEFTLGDSDGNTVSGSATFDSITNIATFAPDAELGILRTYTGKLSSNITHSGGTAITEYNWSFTTREGAWSTEENIEADAFTDFSNPYVARSANGDAIAIWKSVSGITQTVHYNKYTATAGTWGAGPVLTLKSYNNNPVNDLRIAMDNSGNAIAVFTVDPAGANLDLVAAYYNGTTWDVTPTTIDAGGGIASEPQLATDASGNAIAVWLQGGSVYANRYSGTWGTATDIDAGAGTVYTPQLAVFDNGDAVVVWAEFNAIDGYNIIYVNHYDAIGNTWSGATSLGNSAAGSIPQVAAGNGGEAIVVWFQGAGPYSLYASVYDGATWSSPAVLDSDAHISTIPQVGVDNQGNGMALWRAAPTGGADRIRYKIYTAGAGWGGSILNNIDDGVSDAFEPQFVMDQEGHAVVVWRQYTDAMNTVYSTWGNRYRSGSGWGTPTLLESDDSDVAGISSPGVSMDRIGNAMAIWLQDQDASGLMSVWVNPFE